MVNMRILVIETHFQARQSLKALLDGWCRIVRIREAVSIGEALNLLEEFQPLAILLDVRMPKRSGLDAVSLVKEKYPSIKIVVLSLDSDLKADSFVAGADAFVSKSDSPEKLREALADAMGESPWAGTAQQPKRYFSLSREPTIDCTNCEEIN